MGNNETKNGLSSLTLNHIVFDYIHFDRKNFLVKDNNKNINTSVRVGMEETDSTSYRVVLGVMVENSDEYTVEVQATAYISIDETLNVPEKTIKKNVAAILFPYVRAQLTLVTSQPETEPIVLPAVNVSTIIDSIDEDKNSNNAE